jgi:hypothetical protein
LAESIRRVDAAGGNNQRYWIEEIDTTGLWQPPRLPNRGTATRPAVTARKKPNTWQTVHVEVLDGDTEIAGVAYAPS